MAPRNVNPNAGNARPPNRYAQIVERIFSQKYEAGAHDIAFDRNDIKRVAQELNIVLPDNVGDVVYSYRHRVPLPESIRKKAPAGKEWVIRSTGRSKYLFAAVRLGSSVFKPNDALVAIKVPDATPGIILRHALDDEQAVLAMVRYNRLVDIFAGITCYSLESHVRTTVTNIGQSETDEVYVGIDKRGAQYVFPVQAKGHKDHIGVIQIEHDLAMCAQKFPELICRPLAVQRMNDGTLALFEFVEQADEVKVAIERHYKLVPPETVSDTDLAAYRRMQSD